MSAPGKPVGHYLANRLSVARDVLGSWKALAEKVPSAKRNAKRGHVNPHNLALHSNPDSRIHEPMRAKLLEVCRLVLNTSPKTISPMMRRAARQVEKRIRTSTKTHETVSGTPQQVERLTINGSEVVMSPEQFDKLLTKMVGAQR